MREWFCLRRDSLEANNSTLVTIIDWARVLYSIIRNSVGKENLYYTFGSQWPTSSAAFG